MFVESMFVICYHDNMVMGSLLVLWMETERNANNHYKIVCMLHGKPLNYYHLSLFITSLSSSYLESAHENPDKMKYSNNING